MTQPDSPYVTTALSSLGLFAGRVTGSVVGRPLELAAVEQELASARRRMTCLTLEGEPGIGKTRLLVAIQELGRTQGFVPVAVTADEEIRGPFLVARSIFASPEAFELAEGTAAAEPLRRVVDALSSNDDPGLESLSPDRKLLRVFDLAAVALRALAAQRPLAVLVDDLQWADEDSVRMLRYVVRTDAASPVLLAFTLRPDELAFATEAVTLLADIERLGMIRRLKLGRFSQLQSTELLQQVLGGRINLGSAAVMHAQAEGVPFVLAEQARAYRDAGLIQQIDGVWTLARNAARMLPSAVKTLIQRRAARLPDETKSCLAEAAVLGRSFSLRDLRDLRTRLKETGEVEQLVDSLAPAVAGGLLAQHPDGSVADYSFTHGQIREYAAAALTPPRRRAIHGAIVAMLMEGDTHTAECSAMLAQHALAAGQGDLAARCSIEAARAALEAHAPEEALRLADLAHPVASSPKDRVALLSLRDDALDMLRRPAQRFEGLAELAALAEALGDSHLELEVMLRRAAALRLSQEHDSAAELALRVRKLAADRGDPKAELVACLELGQDLTRTELGEAYSQTPSEADLDGAEEAYKRAAALAEQLDDEAKLAAAIRELGVLVVSRVRVWFIERIEAGDHIELMRRIAGGESLDDILPTMPIAPLVMEAKSLFQRALEIFERIGDRQGAMSTIIAIAYIAWGPDIHFPGSAKRIEELRRLTTQLKSFTKESERALAEAQMLFGAHMYARAKLFPDVALAKGKEAYAAAKRLGDGSLEFATASGVALEYADMGDLPEAERWLGHAAAVAAAAPTPLRARKLEAWRGRIMALAGKVEEMRDHLERSVQLAMDQGLPAERCEALALLALEASRLGAERKDEELLALAERSALEAKELLPILPGHPPWGARADAALARVAMARGDSKRAADAGLSAIAALDVSGTEDVLLDIILPAADAIFSGGSEEQAAAMRDRLRVNLGLMSQRILDEDVRVRWFRGPLGRELTRLAGPLATPEGGPKAASPGAGLAHDETKLLQLLTEGQANREIAAALGQTEDEVSLRLAALFAKIGASSRAEATTVALAGKLV